MSEIRFSLNGNVVEVDCNYMKRLIDVLREGFDLTSIKESCGEGECGSCVVFLNEKLVNSCMIPIANVSGKEVTTLEGFKETERFKVIEHAFLKAGGVQCGFCTPGMVMATEAILRRNKSPTLEEVKEGLAGNLCRCTGYQMIFDAVQIIIDEGAELW